MSAGYFEQVRSDLIILCLESFGLTRQKVGVMRPSHPIRSRDGRGKTPNHQDITTRDAKKWGAPAESKAQGSGVLDSFGSFSGHPHCAGLCEYWCLVAIQVTRDVHSQNRERDIALDFGLELDVDVQAHVESKGGSAMATVVIWGDSLPILPMRAGDLLLWCEFVRVLARQLRVGGVAWSSLERRQIRGGKSMSATSRCFCGLFIVCGGRCDPCEYSSRWESILGACCPAEREKDEDGRMRGRTSWPWTS